MTADDALNPERWMPPPTLLFHCHECGEAVEGVEAIAVHLESHGYLAERWPDGGLIFDTTALLDGGDET